MMMPQFFAVPCKCFWPRAVAYGVFLGVPRMAVVILFFRVAVVALLIVFCAWNVSHPLALSPCGLQHQQADMKDDVFLTNMESAAANKLQPDNTLSEETQRHWHEIYSRRRAFHVNVLEAAHMRGLQKIAVLQAYEEW